MACKYAKLEGGNIRKCDFLDVVKWRGRGGVSDINQTVMIAHKKHIQSPMFFKYT